MNIGKVKNKIPIAAGLMIWLFLGIGLGSAGTLTSIKVTTAPVIDGMPEALWNQASVTSIM